MERTEIIICLQMILYLGAVKNESPQKHWNLTPSLALPVSQLKMDSKLKHKTNKEILGEMLEDSIVLAVIFLK